MRMVDRALSKEFNTPGEDSMNVNVGTVDRVIRIVVGVALIAAAATGRIGVWGYIGVLPLLTGVLRVCPAYSLIGMSTCGTKK